MSPHADEKVSIKMSTAYKAVDTLRSQNSGVGRCFCMQGLHEGVVLSHTMLPLLSVSPGHLFMHSCIKFSVEIASGM